MSCTSTECSCFSGHLGVHPGGDQRAHLRRNPVGMCACVRACQPALKGQSRPRLACLPPATCCLLVCAGCPSSCSVPFLTDAVGCRRGCDPAARCHSGARGQPTHAGVQLLMGQRRSFMQQLHSEWLGGLRDHVQQRQPRPCDRSMQQDPQLGVPRVLV